jgi:hypothetical protein
VEHQARLDWMKAARELQLTEDDYKRPPLIAGRYVQDNA